MGPYSLKSSIEVLNHVIIHDSKRVLKNVSTCSREFVALDRIIDSSQNAVAHHAIFLDGLDVRAAQLQSHEADFHHVLPVLLP
jgi:hypothetical protein